jgi:putative tryptophan/tyrosine transport system substrate-binding protein
MNSNIHKIKLVFQTGLVLLALACLTPDAAAQASKLPKIGELWAGSPSETIPFREPFLTRMRELGWVEGNTAHFIVRYYDGADVGKAATFAKELVALEVDVLAITDGACPAAWKATRSVPIVCMDMFDPVAEGATDSLAKPIGNVTGVSWQSIDTAAKRVEIAQDMLGNLKRVALIYDATDPGAVIESKGFAQGAHTIGAKFDVLGLHNAAEVDTALSAIKTNRPDALFVSVNAFTSMHLGKITRAAADSRVPTVSEIRYFAEAGILLTYGVNTVETYSRAGELVHRILKGAKPSQLPFEQPTKFDLVVNLKTAKALGIQIPESIMLRATEVIR